jgi:hypothetical protein
MDFPALIRHIASEMPKLLRETVTLSELMQAYRVSMLMEKREQHASAVEWVEFYFSRPIESDSLKKTLYFLLTERFDDIKELIQYLEEHTPDERKRDSTLTLNHDLVFEIMEYLDFKSVSAFASTCKRVKNLIEVSCDGKWKTKCKADFEHMPMPIEIPAGCLWYDVFHYMKIAPKVSNERLIGLGEFMMLKKRVQQLPAEEQERLDCFKRAKLADEIRVVNLSGLNIIVWFNPAYCNYDSNFKTLLTACLARPFQHPFLR